MYDFYYCDKCNLAKLGQYPTNERLKILYEENYSNGGQLHKTIYHRFKSWFFSSIFYQIWIKIDGDICFHSKNGHGKLLDIGCNDGSGLILYQKNGYNVEGLEINFQAAQFARNKGFKVFVGEVETYETDNLFDVVVLSNILEHSTAPLKVLKQSYRFLKPTGELWISTPNLNSIFRNVFGRYWINWHVPFHMSIFSNKALAISLYKAGFKIVQTKYISPSLWNSQSIVSILFSKNGKKTHQHRNPMLISALMITTKLLFFPILYLVNLTGRGDCCIVEARKIQNRG